MKWIKTDKKLPDNDINVIGYGFKMHNGEKDILGHEKCFVCEVHHFDDGCFVKGLNIEMVITHWMPLPEKPKD